MSAYLWFANYEVCEGSVAQKILQCMENLDCFEKRVSVMTNVCNLDGAVIPQHSFILAQNLTFRYRVSFQLPQPFPKNVLRVLKSLEYSIGNHLRLKFEPTK